MPMKWVEPEIAATGGEDDEIIVYHSYKGDSFNDRCEFWFQVILTEDGQDFDIREWSGYSSSRTSLENVKVAIEAGAIIPCPDDVDTFDYYGLVKEKI